MFVLLSPHLFFGASHRRETRFKGWCWKASANMKRIQDSERLVRICSGSWKWKKAIKAMSGLYRWMYFNTWNFGLRKNVGALLEFWGVEFGLTVGNTVRRNYFAPVLFPRMTYKLSNLSGHTSLVSSYLNWNISVNTAPVMDSPTKTTCVKVFQNTQ